MASTALLDTVIAPLEPHLKTRGLVELCINQPGEVWLETVDGWKHKKDPALTRRVLEQLGDLLATYSGQRFDETTPILATQLPGYGYRVQLLGGAMVDSGISLTIRAGTARTFPLEHYLGPDDAAELAEAQRAGKNVLVVGGTGTGKTTFINSLIPYIPDTQRIIVIEDTKELVVPQPNCVRLLKSKSGTDIAGITYKDIINACMRMRPDRLLVGELDIDNTSPWLRLINTGHAGTMTSLHADSPDKALNAIAQNARLAGMQGTAQEIEDYARQALHYIVHMQRDMHRNITATLHRVRS